MSLPAPKQVKGKPPDKGSFPIDHFNECLRPKEEYMQCLKTSKYETMSCRHLSKAYLQCRMDNELMAQESMTRLGFRESEEYVPPSESSKEASKEDLGYVVGLSRLESEAMRKPQMLSGLINWTIIKRMWRSYFDLDRD